MKRIDNVLFDPYSGQFYANINSSMIKIGGAGKDGNGVTKVDTLPEQGEEGKIYYNTTTGTYYISDNGKWRTFNETTVITSLDDVETPQTVPVMANTYILEPNTFYNISNWKTTNVPSLNFQFDITEGVYAGRFTAWDDNMTVSWPVGIKIPDSLDIDIVADHTYEFNVWQGVLLLTDVTSSESTNVTNDTEV